MRGARRRRAGRAALTAYEIRKSRLRRGGFACFGCGWHP
ncbi:hypothetical protein C7S16_1785 [Burkholderia thailandensis]|uniref:Uncharacterized protein n=1 Tax=Burkholderia thailandensis TaxID=57975 RepID=A0AAW9CW01_BURTH|nr:hypothetical protein [Burkholderia thailandensis]